MPAAIFTQSANILYVLQLWTERGGAEAGVYPADQDRTELESAVGDPLQRRGG